MHSNCIQTLQSHIKFSFRCARTGSFISKLLCSKYYMYLIYLPLPNYVIHGSVFQRIVSMHFVFQTCFIFESCWSATCFGEHFHSNTIRRMRQLLDCCLGWYQCAGVQSRCPRFPNNRQLSLRNLLCQFYHPRRCRHPMRNPCLLPLLVLLHQFWPCLRRWMWRRR